MKPTLNLVPVQDNRHYINIHFVLLARPALPCPPPLLFPSLLFVISFICITDIHGTITLSYCRFAYNVTFHELNQAVVKSLLESSLHDSSMQRQEMSKNLKKVSWLRNDLFRFSSPLSSCERSRFQLAKSFFFSGCRSSATDDFELHKEFWWAKRRIVRNRGWFCLTFVKRKIQLCRKWFDISF